MSDDTPLMTQQQLQDARKLLGWSRERLAVLSETTVLFISRYENLSRVMGSSSHEPLFDGLAGIRATLEAADIIFSYGAELDVKLKRQFD